MQQAVINIILAFFEGFALIVSPCILPLLPILLAGSLEGSKKRPLGIITGFIIAFALFTFFAKKIIQITGIDLTIIRYVSFGLLILLGIIMISSTLTEKLSLWTERLSSFTDKFSKNRTNDFRGGLLFGALLGLVWTPCAGPILAAVIVQTVLQETNFLSFLTILAFAIGVAIPMLLIVYLGRTIINKFRFFKTHTTILRRILGVIIILSVIFMIYADTLALTWNEITLNQKNKTQEFISNNKAITLINGLSKPYPAPEFKEITEWINSNPLQIKDLKGKVVLIDFWAYSCINCIRTFPYLKSWYKKYHDKGLIIVGVHSPEFDFEKEPVNVKKAVKDDGLLYPVALDNNFSTWTNYQNQYWPASYLIDKNGNIVYKHFGEGSYDITENNIRYLLGLKPEQMKHESEITEEMTPETYLGKDRAQVMHSWKLQGKWKILGQKIVAEEANAEIIMPFYAGKVFAVMGSSTQNPIKVKILFNGEVIENTTGLAGEDVVNGSVAVQTHTLYRLLKFSKPQNGYIELISLEPGLEVYTFTFGE